MAEQKRVVNSCHYRRETPLSRDFASLFVFSLTEKVLIFLPWGSKLRTRWKPTTRSSLNAHQAAGRCAGSITRRDAGGLVPVKMQGARNSADAKQHWPPPGLAVPGLSSAHRTKAQPKNRRVWCQSRANLQGRTPVLSARTDWPCLLLPGLKDHLEKKKRYLYPCSVLRGVWKGSGWVLSRKQGFPSFVMGNFWH